MKDSHGPPPAPPNHIDPRFTLANERTFLSWSRTGLALIAAGLAVTELLPRLGEVGTRRIVGVPLMVVGGLIAIAADKHRITVQKSMEAGLGVPKSALPHLLTLTITVSAIAAAALVTFG